MKILFEKNLFETKKRNSFVKVNLKIVQNFFNIKKKKELY